MSFEYKFFSVNKKNEWENGLLLNLQVTQEGIRIGQRDQFISEQTISSDDMVPVSGVIDIATGQHNLIYILDEKYNLWIYDYKNSRLEQQYKSNTSLFTKESRILVYRDVLYVLDPTQLQRLVAISLVNGQVLWSVNDIEGINYLPIDFVMDMQGNLLVLSLEAVKANNGTEASNGNNNFVVVKVSHSGFVSGIIRNEKYMQAEAEDIQSLKQKVFIDMLQDGTFYILNASLKNVTGFTFDGDFKVQFEISGFGNPSGMTTDDKGNLFIVDGNTGGSGEQGDLTIYSFGMLGEEIGSISGYRGRRFKIISDKRNRLFVYNDDEKSIAILKRQSVFDESGISGLPKGVFVSSSFDCTVTETVWHKFEFDSIIPKDTQIKVSYIASDIKDFTIDGRKKDLDIFINSDTLSVEEKLNFLEPLWSKPLINPNDALIFNAKGRYFWIRIEILGSGQKSPLLKNIKVVYPRLSYLRYLPAVYQEDEASRDFLERFLSMFETFFSDMEDKISNVVRYFDAEDVSGESLKWLSQWLGIQVDDSWSEDKLRVLVKRANEIYKKRGTRQGIEELIEIYTGEKPIIIEHFQLKYIEDSAEVRDLFEQLYGTDPYRFYVLFKPNQVNNDQERVAVKQILDSQKPAYTEAVIMLLQPWIYLDRYTYMGVNTYLSEPTVLKLDNQARLPHNTIIIDIDNNTKLEGHSRLDVGINLK